MQSDQPPVHIRPGQVHDEWTRRLAALGPADAKRLGEEIEHSCRELSIWQYTDLVPLQPFVIDATAGRALDDLNAKLGQLVVAYGLKIADGDFSRLADRAGIPGSARWFLPASQPLSRVLGSFRADVLIENGHPQFLEFNFGACLNGVPSTPVLTHALMQSGPGIEVRRQHGIKAESAFAARLAWLKDQLPDGPNRVALLGFARDGDEGSLRAYELEAVHHAVHGLPCDFVPFDEIDFDAGRIYWQGNTYTAAVKYFMANERVLAEHADRVAALEMSGVALFGGQLASLFTSKTLVADLFQDTDLPPAQQRLLDFVPWTARLREGPARRGSSIVDAAEWALTHRERAVLKPCNAFGSRGVVLGWTTAASAWEQVLKEAVKSDDYVVQEAIDPDPWPLTYWDRKLDAVAGVTAPVLAGPFRVGGRSGGCYTKQPVVNDAARLLRSRNGLSFGSVVTAQ
ncbi:MAG TPA: hypothetical protein VFQ44_10825 [Streptosporangiaceae bacterium]|nr:hypothetical protein [Streptosporangiaceae bacterium]